jgi:O-Antigen ligase
MDYALPAPRAPADRYLVLLAAALLGYATLGKGFAYLGFPPLYIGEIALLTGCIVLLRTRCIVATLGSLASVLLAVNIAWTLLRTLPFVQAHGFDAPRDSVVIMYGGFAFIVIAILLEDGRRIDTLVRYYGTFVSFYVPAIPFIFAINHYFEESIPHLPGTDVRMLWLGPSEVATHLAGAAVFALVGFRRATPLWIALLVATLTIVCAWSRGGMLAFAVPVAFGAFAAGRLRQLAALVVVGLAVFGAAYVLEPAFIDYHDARSSPERSVSTRQLVTNVESMTGQGGQQEQGTKRFRLDWWNIIVDDTFNGPHFWGGRGFGLNLADADGFGSSRSKNAPPLRSPHNVHMTILARSGVTGLVLWGALLASWLGMLTRAMWIARRRGHAEWAGLFVFIACYAIAIVINGTFDVTLEAPMQGVWFWCLFGFGIGSVMIYRAQSDDRDSREAAVQS